MKRKQMTSILPVKDLILRNIFFICVSLSAILLFSCGNKEAAKDSAKQEQTGFTKKTIATEQKQNEDFTRFSQKFFSDATFQLSRINFPLRGMSTDLVFDEKETKDTIGENFIVKNGEFFWRREKWVILTEKNLNTKEFTKETKQDNNNITIRYKSNIDDIVVFFIFSPDSEKKWMLTYYSFEWC